MLPGLIGVVQATEAVKLLLGKGEPLIGRLLTYDALGMRFREVRLRKDPKCPLCGEAPTIRDLSIHAAGAEAWLAAWSRLASSPRSRVAGPSSRSRSTRRATASPGARSRRSWATWRWASWISSGQRPVSFLLELDRGTEQHERLRQKARRYARALPRSELATENPVVVVAVPTPARRDNLARTLASGSSLFRVIAWTPERSPLAALRESLPPAHTDPTAPAPPPAPHA